METKDLVDARDGEALVRAIIKLIGDDPDREGLKDTPKRVVRSWKELYSGYDDNPEKYARVFSAEYDQVIVVKGIEYFSMCEHHILPFYGKVNVGYLPGDDNKVLGVSKIARVVDVYARRLQIQEQMTLQIANAIKAIANPKGVAVVVEGTHLCMLSRGVRQQESVMRTSCMLGAFRDNIAARGEVLQLLGV